MKQERANRKFRNRVIVFSVLLIGLIYGLFSLATRPILIVTPYQVKANEDIYEIASHSNLKRDSSEIAEIIQTVNQLEHPIVYEGQILMIPQEKEVF